MKQQIFIFGLSLSTFLGACQPEEAASTPTPLEATPAAAEKDASAPATTGNTTTSKAPSTPRPMPTGFYPVKEPKPQAVCGPEGYAYLWKAYLVPECGGCHYEGNKFNVTAFAQGASLERSYEVMANFVDRQKFADSTQLNEFCIKCILKPEDPLLADIKFFAANVRSCPAP